MSKQSKGIEEYFAELEQQFVEDQNVIQTSVKGPVLVEMEDKLNHSITDFGNDDDSVQSL